MSRILNVIGGPGLDPTPQVSLFPDASGAGFWPAVRGDGVLERAGRRDKATRRLREAGIDVPSREAEAAGLVDVLARFF